MGRENIETLPQRRRVRVKHAAQPFPCRGRSLFRVGLLFKLPALFLRSRGFPFQVTQFLIAPGYDSTYRGGPPPGCLSRGVDHEALGGLDPPPRAKFHELQTSEPGRGAKPSEKSQVDVGADYAATYYVGLPAPDVHFHQEPLVSLLPAGLERQSEGSLGSAFSIRIYTLLGCGATGT